MILGGKKILICQSFIYQINGSTMVTLELAETLKKICDVTVYTTIFDSPAKEIFEEKGIKVVSFDDNPIIKLEDFDFIWIHSQILPKSLINDMRRIGKIKNAPKFIFLHMSPLENCSDERPWIYDLENKLADKVLCISDEIKEVIEPYVDNEICFFRNPCPEDYINRNRTYKKLERVLIVSNHWVEEVIDAKNLLETKYNIEVKILGESGIYEAISPELINQFDAVITIGKTVPMCLLAGIPVYIYDHFGGDGYLNKDNFISNKQTNFSGRNNRLSKTGEIIAKEIIEGYEDAIEFISKNSEDFIEEFSLSKNLDRLFSNIEQHKKQNFDEEYIRYVLTCQDLARHSMFYGSYDSYSEKRKNKEFSEECSRLRKQNKELYDEVVGIRNSRTYKFAKKLSSIFKRKK